MVPNIQWIKQNFDFFNKKYFGGQLRTPRFSVNNCPEGLWGCYDSGTNTLSLTQVYSRPEHSVQEALLHEMIHMYIITVKGVTPMLGGHGPLFLAMASKINADGWKISATTRMTDDDVLYKGERIPDEDDNGSPMQKQIQAQNQNQVQTNVRQNAYQPQNSQNSAIQGMFKELQVISSKIDKLQKQCGLNECKKILISEKQEKYLISVLNEKKTGKKMYFIDPNKVEILKAKLDEKFMPLNYNFVNGGEAQCKRIAGRLTTDGTRQIIQQLYEEDLADWAANFCKDMFLDDEECEKFAKLVVNRWLYNKIGVHGMLDVNYFY